MAEREIVFDLLPDPASNQVDLMELYETFIDDMNEFENDASKNLTQMINSIELKKDESHFKDFLDSIKLIHDINDNLTLDEKARGNKRQSKKSDDIMNVGDQLLDSQIELTTSPEVKLSKAQPQKKPELKTAKSMLGNNFDESQLKLNLKQNNLQPPQNVQPQNNYFNNYQTNRNQNPYLMVDKMDMPQSNMSGMMTGRMTTPSNQTGNYFNQSMSFDQMNYMTQPGMPQSMSKEKSSSDVPDAHPHARGTPAA